MMLVKTKLGQSKISGIGLFADEFIKKGEPVWKYVEKFDILFTKEEADLLPESTKERVYNYAYLDKAYNKYLLCGDDARFFNHSDDPNCNDSYNSNPDMTMANRDIFPGEELTCDYKSFYGNMEDHEEISMKSEIWSPEQRKDNPHHYSNRED